jgi:hypothetical protein
MSHFIQVANDWDSLGKDFVMQQNSEELFKLVRTTMPFGRYLGWRLIDLPEPYVVWFKNQGLPPGELGHLLGLLFEIKANGLEYLFEPIRKIADGVPIGKIELAMDNEASTLLAEKILNRHSR